MDGDDHTVQAEHIGLEGLDQPTGEHLAERSASAGRLSGVQASVRAPIHEEDMLYAVDPTRASKPNRWSSKVSPNPTTSCTSQCTTSHLRRPRTLTSLEPSEPWTGGSTTCNASPNGGSPTFTILSEATAFG